MNSNQAKAKNKPVLSSRIIIAYIIKAVFDGQSLTDAFNEFLAKALDSEKAFIKEVCYGVLRHYSLLEATLNQYLPKKLKIKYILVQYLLISALYQLAFLNKKSYAIVNESVNACFELKFKELTKLVNAILRNFIRDDKRLATSENLAITYSYPSFIIKRLARYLPADKLRTVLENGNQQAPMWLRVHNEHLSTQEYLALLKEHNINAQTTPLCKSAVCLDKACDVNDLPLFNQGKVSVQDLSAQLAAPFLPVKAGDFVLDCCCAPGGKSAHLLDLYQNIKLYCFDSSKERLSLVEQNLNRLNKKAILKVYDATKLHELDVTFDAILVDAPCSGTGVIRRHPDIKWLRRDSDIDALVKLQSTILDSAFSRLKSNGFLLYTTCSIMQEENQLQIENFVKRHSDARLCELKIANQCVTCYQRFPGEDGGDGFFYALLQKI